MAEEEVVNGDIPLSREFEPDMVSTLLMLRLLNDINSPVARVPPVRVEVSVSESGQLRERAQHVLEYH